MWSEFIAEAIALYVEEQHCRIDNRDFYHAELLRWEPNEWGYLMEELLHILEMAFFYYPSTIDEASPGEIEPTCICDQPEVFQETLWQLKAMPERQLWKKKFWETDVDWLGMLVQLVVELMTEKNMGKSLLFPIFL